MSSCPEMLIRIIHYRPSAWFGLPGTAQATIEFCSSLPIGWNIFLQKVELKIGKDGLAILQPLFISVNFCPCSQNLWMFINCYPLILTKIFPANLYNFHFVLKLLPGLFVFVW